MRCVPVVQAAVVAAMALLAGGCGSSPTVHYYSLGTGQGPQKVEASGGSAGGYAVAVGPVSVPAAVDRPQIVIQTGPNRATVLDDSRWVEPLNSAVPRLIATDLGQLLDVPTVIFPRGPITDIKYRVAIDIRSFTSIPGEAATIEAAWTVFGPGDTVKRGQLLASEPVGQSGYDALAAAHGRALMRISREVAAMISAQEKGH